MGMKELLVGFACQLSAIIVHDAREAQVEDL
jgi:hypothetical protein